MKPTFRLFICCSALVALGACKNEDSFTGPGFICDVTNPVEDLTLSPATSTLFVHSPARIDDVTRVTPRATDRDGNTRTDVPIKLVSSDTTVATVDSAGVVKAKKPGVVKITASTCGTTATAQITVSLLTATVLVRADTASLVAGDTVIVHARAVAQDGSTIPGAKFTFGISPSTGATLTQISDSSAVARTSAGGNFTITATGEGASGTTSIQVAPRVFVSGSISSGSGLDVGKDFGCGMLPLGRLYCWGLNGSAQLGAQTDSICFEEGIGTPPSFPCSLSPRRVAPAIVFGSVSAGNGFACGISTSGGSAFCWGDGANGKLGNGKTGSANTPGLVTSALAFTSVSAGGNHACGLATGGLAYCWGSDSVGQLGDARLVNSTTPIPVSGGGATAVFASISAGVLQSCGLQSDGTLFCWGGNDNGQLGDGAQQTRVDTPTLVLGGLHFFAVSAGGDTITRLPFESQPHFESHTCAVAIGGAAYCWGSNAFGELGNGTVGGVGSFSAVPVAVSGGLLFSQISSGGTHTCALTAAGAAYCWGHNHDLQLGRGSGAQDSGAPQQVTGGDLPANVAFLSISAGSRHSCGLATDGFVYCWGSDVFGALGNMLQAAFRGLPQRVAIPK